jgi:hypothetical protein
MSIRYLAFPNVIAMMDLFPDIPPQPPVHTVTISRMRGGSRYAPFDSIYWYIQRQGLGDTPIRNPRCSIFELSDEQFALLRRRVDQANRADRQVTLTIEKIPPSDHPPDMYIRAIVRRERRRR